MATKKVYVIHYWDPRSTEHHFEGREDIVWDKGVFISKDVAEEVKRGMEMFQEVGDPTTFTVRELKLHEEATFNEWMDNNLPGRQKKAETASTATEPGGEGMDYSAEPGGDMNYAAEPGDC